jgi:hypothetical protein
VLWLEHGSEQRRVPLEAAPAEVELPFVPARTLDLMVGGEAGARRGEGWTSWWAGRRGRGAGRGEPVAAAARGGGGGGARGCRSSGARRPRAAPGSSADRPRRPPRHAPRGACQLEGSYWGAAPLGQTPPRPARAQAFDPASNCDETGFVAGATVSVEQVLQQPGGAAAVGLFDMANAMRGRVALVVELTGRGPGGAPPPLEAEPALPGPARAESPFADPK